MKQFGRVTLILVLIGLVSCQQLPFSSVGAPPSSTWTGFLEGEKVDVSAEVGGRLVELRVAEGDKVSPGQLLATLDDELMRKRIQAADANIAAADAQVRLLEAGARPEDIRKAEAQVEQARAALAAAEQALADAQNIRANPQSLLVARAQAETGATMAARQFDAAVKQAQAADAMNSFWEDQVRIMWEGADITLPDGTTRHFNTPSGRLTFAQDEWNKASHAAWEAWAAVKQAEAGKQAAEAALKDIEDQINNPIALDARVDLARGTRDRAAAALQSAEAGLLALKEGASPAQIQAARAAAAQARAARASLDRELERYQVKSPRAGTVDQVLYRQGEVIGPGAPLVSLSVDGDLTLRVFVPMSELANIRLNEPRTVWLPELNRTAEATVSHIADQAEFTGRQPQTDDERNALLIAVELTLKNAESGIKPGMPASVSFTGQAFAVAAQSAAGSAQNVPTLSGSLEARETRIASEVQAQVKSVQAQRGDTVNAGDALIQLDDSAVQDAIKEAEAGVRAAQANLDLVQEKARPGMLAVAEAGVSQSRAEVEAAQRSAATAQRALDTQQELASQLHVWEGKAEAAQGKVTGATAALADLQNQVTLAANDQSMAGKARLTVLQRQAEAAQANLAAAQAEQAGAEQVLALYRDIMKNPLELIAARNSAASQVAIAEKGLLVAQAERDIAQRGPQPEAVAVAEAKLRAAQAGLELAREQARHYLVSSPLTGTVVARETEPGETARPGAALLTIADNRQLEMTVYVPIRFLPDVHVGQAVSLKLPSLPGKAFAGTVDHVASEAEFKPANIYNSQERSELVFAVRIAVPNPDGELKAGLPADVELAVK